MYVDDHIRRVQSQAGKKLKLGERTYQLQGYYSTNLAMDPADPELYMLPVFGRHLSARTGAFIDVGVNVGQSLFKVLTVAPDRRDLGFEPQIACCNDVLRFIAANGLNNAQVLPLGLGNVDGIPKFYSRGRHDSMASLLPEEGLNVSLIPVRRGDDVLAEAGIGEIAMIKVDVEGVEWQVFDGLRETLKRERPTLVFEVLPNFVGHERTFISAGKADHNRERAARLEAVLKESGYTINQIHQDGSERPVPHFNLDDAAHYFSNDYTATPDRSPLTA